MVSPQAMQMVERSDFLRKNLSRCKLFMRQVSPIVEPPAKSRQDPEKGHLVLCILPTCATQPAIKFAPCTDLLSRFKNSH